MADLWDLVTAALPIIGVGLTALLLYAYFHPDTFRRELTPEEREARTRAEAASAAQERHQAHMAAWVPDDGCPICTPPEERLRIHEAHIAKGQTWAPGCEPCRSSRPR